MNNSSFSQLLKTLACVVGCGTAVSASAQFGYFNNNQGVTFVPYGGTYNYSVSWTNGSYPSGGTFGTWVSTFSKPSGLLNLGALYPSTGTFSYNVPFVTSSDDGSYYLNLDGTGSNAMPTSVVYLRVTPGIVQQPTNTTVLYGQSTSLGLIAGPTSATYTWINAATGATISSGPTIYASTSYSGIWIYCKVSNNYGYVNTQPVLLTVLASSPAAFAYVNNNPGVTFAPYGGSFAYSISWTNGAYLSGNTLGTYVNSFSKPSGTISINTINGSTGSFSYTVPYVTSSDDGQYDMSLNGGSGSITTTAVYLHVTPAVVQQPANTAVVNGQTTSLGLIAGPSTATYSWINAATGYSIAGGASFYVNSSMNGMWIYCKISNTYGYVNTSPVLLTVVTNLSGPFAYVNNDPGVQIVPYGGSYSFSVSWTNGAYSNNGTFGTWVNTLYKPGGSIGISALFPSTGSFSYNVPFVTSTDDGAYNLNLNGSGSSLNTSVVYLRVSPGIISQPVETTAAPGVSTTMGLVAGPSNASFTWVDSATGFTVASGASFTANTSLDGKRIYCKISNSYGYTISSPVLIHIGSLVPIITSQPASLTVVLGQPATFRVAASGDPSLAYSWFHNGYLMPGADQDFITIEAATNSDAGAYSCLISNSYGSTNSFAATLGFATYPAITTQPQSLTVTQGQSAVFSAVASGSPIYYYWLKNGVPIDGATNFSLTISNAAATDMATYNFVVDNGLATVTSTDAVLTVWSTPVILTQPAGQSVGVGSNFVLNVAADGYPALAYQWRLNSAAISGATNSAYAVAAAQNTDAGNYDIVITNSMGSVTSTIANVAVTTYLPVITSQPAGTSAVSGAAAAFSVSATGSALSYQWYEFSTNVAAAVPVVIDGFVLAATVTNAGGGYVLVPNVQIVGGGGSGATATATVSNGLVVAVDLTSAGSGYTSAPVIQIDPPAAGLANQTGASLNFASVTASNAGTYLVVVTNASGSAISSNATLTVNMPVYIVTQPQSQSVPLGSNATFTVAAAGDAPLAWQWYEISTNQATATALVMDGFVYGANVVNGGAGYAAVPNVQIIGGGGSGALATAALSNGVVTAIIVSNAGSGYVGVPSLQIDPPAGVPLSGQTNAVFGIVGVGTNDAGDYFVVINNNYGSVTSVLAGLTINLSTSNIVQNPTGPALSAGLRSGGLWLQFTGAANSSYVILTATNLVPPVVWQPLATNSADVDGHWEFTDTNLLGGQKFYRAISNPAP